MGGQMPSSGEAVKVAANSSKCFSLPACVTFISHWLNLSQLDLLQVLLHIRCLGCRECIFLGSLKRCRINTLVHRDDSVYETICVFQIYGVIPWLSTTYRPPQLRPLRKKLNYPIQTYGNSFKGFRMLHKVQKFASL